MIETRQRRKARNRAKRGHRPGLDKKGRIDWQMAENVVNRALSQYGLAASAISRQTGMSCAQISYRNRKMGIRLTDYRQGRGPVVQTLLTTFTVESVSSLGSEELETLIRKFGIS